MDRKEALERLRKLVGRDLRVMAKDYGITVWKKHSDQVGSTPAQYRINKGWPGHVCERYLGLPLNTAQSPNFGSWELKVVSLKRGKRGALLVKETMAITMIDPVHLAATPFEQSHLFAKLRKAIIVARIHEGLDETHSAVYSVTGFDLDDPTILAQVRADYNEARAAVRARGAAALKSSMGKLIQPRTKGPGHGSTSRAFYARTRFVAHIVDLEPL